MSLTSAPPKQLPLALFCFNGFCFYSWLLIVQGHCCLLLCLLFSLCCHYQWLTLFQDQVILRSASPQAHNPFTLLEWVSPNSVNLPRCVFSDPRTWQWASAAHDWATDVSEATQHQSPQQGRWVRAPPKKPFLGKDLWGLLCIQVP